MIQFVMIGTKKLQKIAIKQLGKYLYFNISGKEENAIKVIGFNDVED